MVHSDTSSSMADGPEPGIMGPAKPAQTQPGDDLRARIEMTVAAIVEKLSPVPQLERSLRRWRIGFFLLGVVSTAIIAVALHIALPTLKGADAFAVLAPGGSEPGFVLALGADGRDVLVRRLAATPAAGEAHHLWLIRDGAAPTLVGRLASDDMSRLPRPSGLTPKSFATARFTVSLDAADNNAPGAPGPIVYSGRIVPVTP